MKLRKLGAENESNKKIVKAVKIVAVVFLVVFFIEIWVSTRLSTYGNKIQDLKVAKAGLELENQVLENEIAEKTSLLSIEFQANIYGFDTAKNLEYVKPLNLASLP